MDSMDAMVFKQRLQAQGWLATPASTGRHGGTTLPAFGLDFAAFDRLTLRQLARQLDFDAHMRAAQEGGGSTASQHAQAPTRAASTPAPARVCAAACHGMAAGPVSISIGERDSRLDKARTQLLAGGGIEASARGDVQAVRLLLEPEQGPRDKACKQPWAAAHCVDKNGSTALHWARVAPGPPSALVPRALVHLCLVPRLPSPKQGPGCGRGPLLGLRPPPSLQWRHVVVAPCPAALAPPHASSFSSPPCPGCHVAGRGQRPRGGRELAAAAARGARARRPARQGDTARQSNSCRLSLPLQSPRARPRPRATAKLHPLSCWARRVARR